MEPTTSHPAPRTIGAAAWAALSSENREGIVAHIARVCALPPHLNDYLHYPELGLQAAENLLHERAALLQETEQLRQQVAGLKQELGEQERQKLELILEIEKLKSS